MSSGREGHWLAPAAGADAAAEAAEPTGVEGVDSDAEPPGVLATAAADGSDGSDAGASGGGVVVAPLDGTTTAVAGGASAVCRWHAASRAAAIRAIVARRDVMKPSGHPDSVVEEMLEDYRRRHSAGIGAHRNAG